MKKNTFRLLAVLFSGIGISYTANAGVYLNNQNITVSLGNSMAAEPFQNQTAAISLANIIDAPSADAAENHISPTTHVWVSGNALAGR